MTDEITEQPGAGHFIGAAHCKWTRHHHVGSYCVSSIGQYDPDGNGEFVRLSSISPTYYETMVFPIDENGETVSWSERASDRYTTREGAEAGHEAMIAEVQGWAQWTEVEDENGERQIVIPPGETSNVNADQEPTDGQA